MIISNEDELRNLYGWPKGRAKSKVLKELDKHSINFIENSPFLVISTFDSKGKSDASPRGGIPGFVQVLDSNTILIPDTKGPGFPTIGTMLNDQLGLGRSEESQEDMVKRYIKDL